MKLAFLARREGRWIAMEAVNWCVALTSSLTSDVLQVYRFEGPGGRGYS